MSNYPDNFDARACDAALSAPDGGPAWEDACDDAYELGRAQGAMLQKYVSLATDSDYAWILGERAEELSDPLLMIEYLFDGNQCERLSTFDDAQLNDFVWDAYDQGVRRSCVSYAIARNREIAKRTEELRSLQWLERMKQERPGGAA